MALDMEDKIIQQEWDAIDTQDTWDGIGKGINKVINKKAKENGISFESSYNFDDLEFNITDNAKGSCPACNQGIRCP